MLCLKNTYSRQNPRGSDTELDDKIIIVFRHLPLMCQLSLHTCMHLYTNPEQVCPLPVMRHNLLSRLPLGKIYLAMGRRTSSNAIYFSRRIN